MPDIADAISDASRCWPSPVAFLWLSAARIAIVVCRPAITSNAEMPARYGGPAGAPGEGHQPGHGLHHEVVARQGGAAAAAEPANRGVDDRRVLRADRVVVQAVPGQPARLEVLHEHVRAAGE